MERSQRPAHIIRHSEVASWLADSVVKLTTVHRTTAESAAAILRDGVRIDQSAVDVRFGFGFYTTTHPHPQYGNANVRVAIRLQHPFIANDPIEGDELVDTMRQVARSDDTRSVLQAAGYDGVVVHFPDGEMWVIAFADDQVKIVRG